jgi:hypothetical protein
MRDISAVGRIAADSPDRGAGPPLSDALMYGDQVRSMVAPRRLMISRALRIRRSGEGNPGRPAIWCGRRRPEIPGGAVPGDGEIRESIPGTNWKSRFVGSSRPARHSDMWANRRCEPTRRSVIVERIVDQIPTRLCFFTMDWAIDLVKRFILDSRFSGDERHPGMAV